jgi:hypothetical protein
MSAWRRTALELLPDQRSLIETSENPMALWIELTPVCEKAHSSGNHSAVSGFYQFARWCWRSTDADLRTAVACGFYEHLPTMKTARKDIPRWFDRDSFNELREVFSYHLTSDEAAEFEREFFGAKQKLLDEAFRPKLSRPTSRIPRK